MRIEFNDGRSVVVGGSPFLADILTPGASCPPLSPTAETPSVVQAAPEVDLERVERIANVVAQPTGNIAIANA